MNREALKDAALGLTAVAFAVLGLYLWGLILGWWH